MKSSNPVYFMDKFTLPKESEGEFKKQLNYNRTFLKSLTGIIRFDVMEQEDEEKNLIIITVALWKNQSFVDEAKVAMQEEFKRIKFIPTEFYNRLNIKVERGQFKSVE
jgi:hypothetical protein